MAMDKKAYLNGAIYLLTQLFIKSVQKRKKAIIELENMTMPFVFLTIAILDKEPAWEHYSRRLASMVETIFQNAETAKEIAQAETSCAQEAFEILMEIREKGLE